MIVSVWMYSLVSFATKEKILSNECKDGSREGFEDPE